MTARAGVAATADRTRNKTGVAVGDYDNDGWLDLYVTALGPNTLFRNNGDGTFTDVTAPAGVAGGRSSGAPARASSIWTATAISICTS